MMTPSQQVPFKIYTAREVAQILRMSTETVRRLHRRGDLDALPCRHLRFTAQSIANFVGRKNKRDPEGNV